MNQTQKAEQLLNQLGEVILSAIVNENLRIKEIKIDPDNSSLVYYDYNGEETAYDYPTKTVSIKTPTLDT